MIRKKLTFGTDGIRGRADQCPFTYNTLYQLGHALGQFLEKKYTHVPHPHKIKILIGQDTRESCDRIQEALTAGLNHFPVTIVHAGVIPTPTVCQIISQDPKYHFGIMISASHNPYYDNGIKLFNAQAGKISAQDEHKITCLFDKIQEHRMDFMNNTITKSTVIQSKDTHLKYLQSICMHVPKNLLAGLKIVLDCAHGATSNIAPEVFKYLKAQVIVIGAQPDGKNINDQCGALSPQMLKKAIRKHQADIGFAFDGDGDRVIIVNKHGAIKDGDDILYVLSQLPEYEEQKNIVGTVMTNTGLEKILNKQNKKLLRTSVGDKYIAQKLAEKNLLLGGEASGHIIMKNYLPSGDGIFVALKVLQALKLHNNFEFNTFEKYAQTLINVPVQNKKDLTQEPYATIVNQHKPKDGRVLVRYSGTENLLRIMTEAYSNDESHSTAHTLAQKLQSAL